MSALQFSDIFLRSIISAFFLNCLFVIHVVKASPSGESYYYDYWHTSSSYDDYYDYTYPTTLDYSYGTEESDSYSLHYIDYTYDYAADYNYYDYSYDYALQSEPSVEEEPNYETTFEIAWAPAEDPTAYEQARYSSSTQAPIEEKATDTPEIFQTDISIEEYTCGESNPHAHCPGDDEDHDYDDLSNREERIRGTDPNNHDSDGDGLPDGLEVSLGLDPLSFDSDQGYEDDFPEWVFKRNPLNHTDDFVDWDGDGVNDCRYSGQTDCDLCPEDFWKTEPKICGCGSSETDSDKDGHPDCVDICSHDPGKNHWNLDYEREYRCGCGYNTHYETIVHEEVYPYEDGTYYINSYEEEVVTCEFVCDGTALASFVQKQDEFERKKKNAEVAISKLEDEITLQEKRVELADERYNKLHEEIQKLGEDTPWLDLYEEAYDVSEKMYKTISEAYENLWNEGLLPQAFDEIKGTETTGGIATIYGRYKAAALKGIIEPYTGDTRPKGWDKPDYWDFIQESNNTRLMNIKYDPAFSNLYASYASYFGYRQKNAALIADAKLTDPPIPIEQKVGKRTVSHPLFGQAMTEYKTRGQAKAELINKRKHLEMLKDYKAKLEAPAGPPPACT